MSGMKQKIRSNIGNPEALESLFRKDKTGFSSEFAEAASGIDTELVRFWRIRLSRQDSAADIQLLKKNLLRIVIISGIVALLVKSHLLFGHLRMEDFLLRNLPLIIFASLTSWFILKNGIRNTRQILILVIPSGILAVYLNLLPRQACDSTTLAFIHAPVFMWFIFGLAWISFKPRDTANVSAYIRYNGELAIMYGLLCIAGAMLSGMTIGLFAVIGKDIGKFYMENIGIVGVAVFPVLAALLIDIYPDITSRIAPVIARIFTPLLLTSVIIYLVALTVSGIDLSKNRDFLIIFNLLLLAVMAIIVFSLSETDKSNIRKLNVILLFLLAAGTLAIDLFALSAIISRLSFGFTPNRTVVLISNLLILVNLLLILPDLFLAGFKGRSMDRLEKIIYGYLPVYFLYCIVVIFVLPFIFGMNQI